MKRAARWVQVGLLFALLGCRGRALPHQGKSVAELEQMLRDPRPAAQAQGALGLSQHGPAAAPALPELVRLLDSPDAVVRQQSALALGKIGPEARTAVSALVRLLRDEQWAVRRQAALALGDIGPEAAEAVPALEALREGPANSLVQKAAADALNKIRPPPQPRGKG
jgi:HEAT repeat protein